MSNYLTVSDLEKLLKDFPKDAIVTINGSTVCSLEEIKGKIKEGYLNDNFSENPKGTKRAIRFLHWTERSDGVVDYSHIWNP